MSLFSKLKNVFSNNKENEEIILKLNNEINKLSKENLKLKSLNKSDKDNNEIIKKEIENLKKKIEGYKGEIKFKFIDNEIESQIIEQLSSATKEINIAVAWITSEDIIVKLEAIKKDSILKGDYIRINTIISKDENKENNDEHNKKLQRLKQLSDYFSIVDVNKKDSIYTNYMHNKYCIIDNYKVIDGSYNWSKNAKYSEEHIIILENKSVAKEYKENFDRLIKEYGNN